jgi:hypothetical protein
MTGRKEGKRQQPAYVPRQPRRERGVPCGSLPLLRMKTLIALILLALGSAVIGAGAQPKLQKEAVDLSTPENVMAAFYRQMSKKDGAATVALMTDLDPDNKQFMLMHIETIGNRVAKQEVKVIETKVDGDLAATVIQITGPGAKVDLSEYWLIRQNGQWKLTLTAMGFPPDEKKIFRAWIEERKAVAKRQRR